MEISRKSKPAVGLATLLDEASAQAADYRQVQKAAGRYRTAIAALDPKELKPEALNEKKQELHQQMAAVVDPILRQIAERHARARAAGETWQPARRRLDAAISDPVTAAALVGVVAQASELELPRLAQEAVRTQDWLLAGAVAARIEGIPGDTSKMDAWREVKETLNRLDAENTTAAFGAVSAIGRHYAQARILAGEATGKPLTTHQQLTLAHENPGLMTPTTLPAA